MVASGLVERLARSHKSPARESVCAGAINDNSQRGKWQLNDGIGFRPLQALTTGGIGSLSQVVRKRVGGTAAAISNGRARTTEPRHESGQRKFPVGQERNFSNGPSDPQFLCSSFVVILRYWFSLLGSR